MPMDADNPPPPSTRERPTYSADDCDFHPPAPAGTPPTWECACHVQRRAALAQCTVCMMHRPSPAGTPREPEIVAAQIVSALGDWEPEDPDDEGVLTVRADQLAEFIADTLRAAPPSVPDAPYNEVRIKHESAWRDRLAAGATGALKTLGERLAHLLDSDQFNNAEPLLLQIAAGLASAVPDAGEVSEEVAMRFIEAVRPDLSRHARNNILAAAGFTVPEVRRIITAALAASRQERGT